MPAQAQKHRFIDARCPLLPLRYMDTRIVFASQMRKLSIWLRHRSLQGCFRVAVDTGVWASIDGVLNDKDSW